MLKGFRCELFRCITSIKGIMKTVRPTMSIIFNTITGELVAAGAKMAVSGACDKAFGTPDYAEVMGAFAEMTLAEVEMKSEDMSRKIFGEPSGESFIRKTCDKVVDVCTPPALLAKVDMCKLRFEDAQDRFVEKVIHFFRGGNNKIYIDAEKRTATPVYVAIRDKVYQVHTMKDLYREVSKDHEELCDIFDIEVGGKVLNRNNDLIDYDLENKWNSGTIRIYRLLGGNIQSLPKSEQPTPRKLGYSNKKLGTRPIRKGDLKVKHLKLQGVMDDALEQLKAVVTLANKYVNRKLVKLIEDLLIFIKLANDGELMMACIVFVKLQIHDITRLVGGAMEFAAKFYKTVLNLMKDDMELQSFEEDVLQFRHIIDRWEEVKESTIGKKFGRVLNHLVSFGAFRFMGVNPTAKNFRDIHAVNNVDWTAYADFSYGLVDVISLTLHRALVWHRTGKWEVMLHGARTYQEWYDKCIELKRNSMMLSNLKLIGKTYFEFVSDVKDAIAMGENIVRYGSENKFESRSARSMLNDMKTLDLNILTAKAAHEERAAPFSILVNGESSVGKSMFTKILFYAYGKYRNLPIGDEYRFVRDPRQQFYNGFASYMWCIQLDDIAYLNADQELDQSLMELITICNNVPFVPDQAALEDKGRTPFRGELVIGTTNTKTLNAYAYFSCPLAVLRRMPWIVSITPKAECARDDAPAMLDGSKVTKPDGTWMNVWDIVVEKVVPGDVINGSRRTAKYDKIAEFDDIYVFLDWYKQVVIDYNELQHQAMLHDDEMSMIELCDVCNRPRVNNSEIPVKHKCCCELQSNVVKGIVLNDENYGQLTLTIVGKNVFGAQDFAGNIVDVDLTGTAYGQPMVTDDGEYQVRYDIVNSVVVREAAFPVENAHTMLPKSNTMSKDLQDVLDLVLQRQVKREVSFLNRATVKVGAYLVKTYFSEGMMYKFVQFCMGWSVFRKGAMRLLHHYLDFAYSGTSYFVKLGKLRQDFQLASFAVLIAGLSALGLAIFGVKKWNDHRKENLRKKEEKAKYDHVAEFYKENSDAYSIEACRQVVEDYDAKHPGNDRRYQDTEIDWTDKVNGDLECKVIPPSIIQRSQPSQNEVDDTFFVKNEKENVWKKVDLEVTNFDIDPRHCNYGAMDGQQLRDILRRNVFRMTACGDKNVRGHAVCVGGYLFVTNNHLMPTGDRITITLSQEPASDGVTGNVEYQVGAGDMVRMPEKDLVWFQCLAMAPHKDISKLLAKSSYNMGNHRGFYVSRNIDTSANDRTIKAITSQKIYCEGLDREFQCWVGTVSNNTECGDCGSPMIIKHDQYAVWCGLHQLGNPMGVVCAAQITIDDYVEARKFFTRPIIQSGTPMLQSESAEKRSLEPFGPKSPLCWITHGSANKYGHFTGSRPAMRSRVESTMLAERFTKERGWDCPFTAPKFDWKPYNNMYNDVLASKDIVDTIILEQAIDAFSEDIIARLPKKALDELKIISWDAALNGIDGVQYLDKMNFNSSMGFPWNKSKRFFLTPSGVGDKKKLPEEVMNRAYFCEEQYKKGIRFHPVFSGQCKDEPRDSKKVAAGKIRIFTGAPVDWSLCVRRYLLTTIKTIMENQEIFEAAPGCVAQSLEWERFREFLVQHGLKQLLAGDYGKFDKRMVAKMILAAYNVLINVLKAAGWSEDELLVIWGIANDTAYPLTNMNGDLIEFFGTNPSGHPLTVIINCIVNALYFRYCYIILNPAHEAKTFKQNVALLTYGDDNASGVSSRAPWFNHTAIQEVLASIGVEYTMADKESESVPYIDFDEVSFLKRTWRWDEDVDAWLCPLDPKSIHKSLMIHIPSKTVSNEQQMIDTMHSAINEWFFHGRDVFEKERKYLLTVVFDSDLEAEYRAKPFPTWDDLVFRFKKASKDVCLDRFGGAPAPPEWFNIHTDAGDVRVIC
nr:MAG: hypothetical protein 1 [Marnaviridae sp.]